MAALRLRLSRRSLLAALCGAAIQMAAAAQRQLSQAEAEYRDRPRSGFGCAACALFRPPRACVVVAGDISPDGWCRFFDLPD